ncbi:hypothetical protein I8748_15915 [Nostoc sp. CENA67]|uniref:Uncharacterized protein n=1 Tax=Amazonocrinis nigriterrae CENA67 TaxID=2794033 RepID=A0A8J7HTW2_9NOST|nr:hypothetical protein [Amazonocrinis nigriterrae]MBH8563658.1 hypothetical protein [Amazonocrinis nigriterrae CENA67]
MSLTFHGMWNVKWYKTFFSSLHPTPSLDEGFSTFRKKLGDERVFLVIILQLIMSTYLITNY